MGCHSRLIAAYSVCVCVYLCVCKPRNFTACQIRTLGGCELCDRAQRACLHIGVCVRVCECETEAQRANNIAAKVGAQSEMNAQSLHWVGELGGGGVAKH